MSRAATIAALLLAGACGSEAGQGGDALASIEFPLFDSDLLQQECGERTKGYLLESLRSDVERTAAPTGIAWMSDLDAALERAEEEGKPVFVNSHVRKHANLDGDPHCDV